MLMISQCHYYDDIRPSWPGSQQVTHQFNRLDIWSTYLASSEDVIYAMVDVRGSSARGSHFEHAIYRQLGKLETADLISTVMLVQIKLCSHAASSSQLQIH